MAVWLHNLRHAWRMVGAGPLTSAMAVVVLALGIGSTGIQFAVIDGIVLRPLPVPEGERVVHVDCRNPLLGRKYLRVYLHDFLDWREAQSTLTDLGAFTRETVSLSDDDGYPEQLSGSRITPDVLTILRVQPLLGRAFTAADANLDAPPVALLGYQAWIHRFAGRQDVLGQVIRLHGEPATVVGVMPRGFQFPRDQEIWRPLATNPTSFARGEGPALELVGRLRDGVRLQEARSELQALAGRTAAAYPELSAGREASVLPYTRRFVSSRFLRQFYLMYGAAWLVMLIACANVASLLTVRTEARAGEIALRTVLGAGRLQVLGQVLAESLALTLLGAVLGLAVAWAGTVMVGAILAKFPMPYWMSVEFSIRLAASLGAASLVSALASGIYPAWKATRVRPWSVLKDESRGRTSRGFKRFGRILLVMNVAFAWVLLVYTALLVRSAIRVSRIEVGVDPQKVFTARLELPSPRYPERDRRLRFVEELTARMARRPEVLQVAATTNLPGEGADRTFFALPDEVYASREDYPQALKAAVTPEFFELFHVQPIEGRLVETSDRPGTEPIVLVNQSFAERTWPGEAVIGKRLRLGRESPEEPWRRVVGLVPDLPMGSLQDPAQEGLYLPYSQDAGAAVALVVLPRKSPSSFAELARTEVHALDPDLPIFRVKALEDVMWLGGFAEAELFTTLFTALGLLALFLGALGIYSLSSAAVNQRTAEIGLRIALGAQRRRILTLILAEGLWTYLFGLAGGILLATFTTPQLRAALYDVDPFDAPTFAAVAGFLAFVAFLGSVVPAYRASRIEPSRALHAE